MRPSGANVNVFVKTPGNGSSAWDPGFGVYGEASVLYAGSIGAGTSTGLYEASGVMASRRRPRRRRSTAADDGMLPVDDADGGGGILPAGGCGCSLAPTAAPPLGASRSPPSSLHRD